MTEQQNLGFGTVYLIGAGPGDPGLITVRGMELIKKCDVIVYDRLAHPSLLNHARHDAERIYVGKASANHAMRQPDINNLLVERAREGKSVARLKGGDPLVFGRGGEEAERCREEGVAFEFIPGVTSAIAAGAYAGIPVTHRDAASSFAVITGHERDDEVSRQSAGAAEGRRNWKNIAWAADTLIFLMGVENLSEISARLIEHGRDPETPVGLVQWGTWPRQRVVTGILSSIVETVAQAGITSPAVCIVGEVVRLREKLRWFDDITIRPLFGKRILVTRAREQASALSDALLALGAEPVEFPTIRIVPRAEAPALLAAIQHIGAYRWLVFTSTNSVDQFGIWLTRAGKDSRALAGLKVAAIGPATAHQVTIKLGIVADYIPAEAVAEAVLSGWPDPEMSGTSVLIPRAAEAREVLPEGLRNLGARVDVIPVYDTVLDTSSADALLDELKNGQLTALTFTSSSTVTNFLEAIGSPDEATLKSLLSDVDVFVIGPITARTLRDAGIEPNVSAEKHTIPGLIEAISGYYASKASDLSHA